MVEAAVAVSRKIWRQICRQIFRETATAASTMTCLLFRLKRRCSCGLRRCG
jgi:hypothetical protein